MPYQIREFHALLSDTLEYEKSKKNPFGIEYAFSDIYVFKSCSVHIGVKFRDIQQKKYGYKIQAVEIKIDKESLESKNLSEGSMSDSHLRFYQKWKKYEVDFKYKLLKPSVFEDSEELQRLKNKEIEKAEWKNENPYFLEEINLKYKSYESQMQHLNTELTHKIKFYLGKKENLKNELYRQNFISEWFKMENPIDELFLIMKKKFKTASWESGKIIAETFSGQKLQIKDLKGNQYEVKALILETFSQEDSKKPFIEAKVDPVALKLSQKQLSFQDLYNISNQEENLVQRHKKGEKYVQNTSYPQLLKDIYQNCLNKK